MRRLDPGELASEPAWFWVFVDFPDAPSNENAAGLASMYTAYLDWFQEASYGRFSWNGHGRSHVVPDACTGPLGWWSHDEANGALDLGRFDDDARRLVEQRIR